MDELKKIAEALGLDASADEAKITERIKALQSERDEAKAEADEAKDSGESLEDRAKKEGKVVIETDQLKKLSDRVAESEQKLADAEFNRVFDAALKDPKGPRVDAKPETRERYRKLFDQDRDTTVELLEAAQPLVKSSPEGKGGSDEITESPDGVDPEMSKLDKQVKAYAKEHKLSYVEALDAVQTELDQEGALV
jgi:hypothetical protein